MSVIDKLNDQAYQVKEGVKTNLLSLCLFVLKVLSGMIIGLVFAIVLKELTHSGDFSFLFVVLVATTVFIKFTKTWGFVTLLIFDLICVLIAMLLRMYILIAPG